MTIESNNTFEEANENILDNEDETVYFNKQEFAEIICNKIFYDVYGDRYTDEADEAKGFKEIFKSIFLRLVSVNDSIEEFLSYLGINEYEKDYEHLLLTAIEQTLLITEIENISEKNDKLIEILSSIESTLSSEQTLLITEIENISEKNGKLIEKMSSIESTLSSIESTMANISVSYEYKRLRIYVANRKEEKVREVGGWFNKTTESYYEDVYYYIIQENGKEVKRIERVQKQVKRIERVQKEEIDEAEFLSLFNKIYGINGWELFNSPETIYNGYECLIKKQTKALKLLTWK